MYGGTSLGFSRSGVWFFCGGKNGGSKKGVSVGEFCLSSEWNLFVQKF